MLESTIFILLTLASFLVGIPLAMVWLTKNEEKVAKFFKTGKFFFISLSLSFLFYLTGRFINIFFYLPLAICIFASVAWVRMSQWR